MTLEYANRKTKDDAKRDLADLPADGKYTAAHAFDRAAGHWAYPDRVLEDLGFKVAFYGDTGGYGFAITTDGICLSSNSRATPMTPEQVEEYRVRAASKGWIGKRLHNF